MIEKGSGEGEPQIGALDLCLHLHLEHFISYLRSFPRVSRSLIGCQQTSRPIGSENGKSASSGAKKRRETGKRELSWGSGRFLPPKKLAGRPRFRAYIKRQSMEREGNYSTRGKVVEVMQSRLGQNKEKEFFNPREFFFLAPASEKVSASVLTKTQKTISD